MLSCITKRKVILDTKVRVQIHNSDIFVIKFWLFSYIKYQLNFSTFQLDKAYIWTLLQN